MIRPCVDSDFADIFTIINDAAQAYRGVIPADRWHEPYMLADALRSEIASGVSFSGYCDDDGALIGVMGIQDVKDVTLIRHAYVRTTQRRSGIGGKLLRHLLGRATRPVLIGTWRDAAWAINFYRKYGFELVDEATKTRLLNTYWSIPARQVETSVVLTDERWRNTQQ